MVKKEYKKEELIVVWQPDLCIHSGICFHRLPSVFKPRDRPWVQMDGGDLRSIEETVNACPSGALSLKPAALPATEKPIPSMSQVKVFVNGPVRVQSPCEVELSDGTVVVKPNGASFCRCGGSANKPFCDGSHKINGFTG